MMRDINSKALLETDISELKRYRADKKRDREIHDLRKEVQSLAECINRIEQTVARLESK